MDNILSFLVNICVSIECSMDFFRLHREGVVMDFKLHWCPKIFEQVLSSFVGLKPIGSTEYLLDPLCPCDKICFMCFATYDSSHPCLVV